MQAKTITESLKSSNSLKELHLAAIKVYSTESFLYREINNFLLDYEKLKSEKEKNPKEYSEIFKSYAPFSWFLDQTLKLTPKMSKDNIWEPMEEVDCSNTEYKLYRSVTLDEVELEFYKNAFYSSKKMKKGIRDISGLFDFPEFGDIAAGYVDQQDIFYWEGFSSTTQDISILNKFVGNVHFYIRTCSIREEDAPISCLDRTKLKLIMHKSMRKEEEEILLPPGITFTIDRIATEEVKKRKLTKIYITLNPESDFVPIKNLIVIKKSSYNIKSKYSFKRIISFVEDKLQKRDINLFKEVLIYATKKKSIFVLNFREFQPTRLKQGSTLSMKFLDNVAVFNENMESFFEKDNLFQLRCSFLPGDQFVPFTAEDIFSKNKKVLIKIANEPLCIIFWTLKKLSFMTSIYDYLKVKKTNLPKIRIIFVNLDWGILSLGFDLKLIEKCFPDAQKIFGKNSFYGNIDNFSTYGELKPPNILIVDKNGKINLCEKEKNFNLLSKLDAVHNPDFFQIFPNKGKTEISRKDYLCLKLESKKPEFSEAITELQKSFRYSVGILIYGEKQRIIQCVTEEERTKGITSANERSKKYYQPTAVFTSEMRDCEDLTSFREFFNKFKIKLAENVGPKIIKTFLFKKGNLCNICKIKISNEQAHYYCYVCNLYYCEVCGNKTNPEKRGNSKYLDTHNLIFINIPLNESIERIDVYKLGNNKQFTDDKTDFGFECDICSETPNHGFRWICLNCRPGPFQKKGFVDFCSKCFEIIQSKENSQLKKEILRKLETEEGHNNDKHIYLRICFGDSYKDY